VLTWNAMLRRFKDSNEAFTTLPSCLGLSNQKENVFSGCNSRLDRSSLVRSLLRRNNADQLSLLHCLLPVYVP
jgi:hypothetical protein